MMAPAAMPPRMPAPTAQPMQRASAVDGAAVVAKPITAAAAKAVRIFVMWSLVGGAIGGHRARFTADSIVRIGGTREKEPGQFVGNLFAVCRYAQKSEGSAVAHGAFACFRASLPGQ